MMHPLLPVLKHGISYIFEWKLSKNKKEAQKVAMTSVGKQVQSDLKTNPKVQIAKGKVSKLISHSKWILFSINMPGL